MSSSSRWLILIGFVLYSLSVASLALADHGDPSGRVARVTHAQGEVSYSPAGEDQWLGVMRNRPLIRGDRLWTGRNARAELQVGSAALRLGSSTSFEILELNDRVAQVQLSQGTLGLTVRGMYSGQFIEVDTPTLAFTIDQPGRYRIDVAPDEDVTTIVVWEGEGEAYGEDASFPLAAGDTVRFYGADLRDYEMYGTPRMDDFDRYGLDRDQRLADSESLRYIGDDMAGYSDLDDYGTWRRTNDYGNVWFPSRVDAGWAPYRDGHWIWQQPWGWTWVDNAPWGFAPSHYGRWAYLSDRWGWIPGPRNVRPIYAPALVAFVGGRGWSLSVQQGDASPIGWFPLGPREVYVPSYRTSREYFTQVNVNNTVITTANITEGYADYSRGDGSVRQASYANREVAGGVTAVPREVFVNARSVRQAAMQFDRNAFETGEVSRLAPIAPSVRSVLGAGQATRVARPSDEVFDRRVVARSAPPPAEQPFAARERRLQQTPGRSPEPSAGGRAQDRNPGNARNVRVLAGQRDAVNVREAEQPAARTGDASALKPLDRSSQARAARVPVDQPQRNVPQHQEAQQRQAEAQQQQAQRQAEAQQRQAETQQRQAEAQQQAQQRQAEAQQQQEVQRQQAQQQEAQRQQQAEAQQEAQRQAVALREAQRASRNEAQQQAQAQRQTERELRAAQQQDEPPSESDASPQEDRGNRPADKSTKGPRHRKAKDTDDEESKDEDAAKEDPRDPAAYRNPTRTPS